jgi:hypothetical protein
MIDELAIGAIFPPRKKNGGGEFLAAYKSDTGSIDWTFIC